MEGVKAIHMRSICEKLEVFLSYFDFVLSFGYLKMKTDC